MLHSPVPVHPAESESSAESRKQVPAPAVPYHLSDTGCRYGDRSRVSSRTEPAYNPGSAGQ